MEAGRTSSGMWDIWDIRRDGWIRNGKLTELVSRYARPASFLEKERKSALVLIAEKGRIGGESGNQPTVQGKVEDILDMDLTLW